MPFVVLQRTHYVLHAHNVLQRLWAAFTHPSALCVCSRGMVGWIVLILVAWIFINWTATYFALSKLNFLKR